MGTFRSSERTYDEPTEKGFLRAVVDAMVSDGYGLKVWKVTRQGTYNCIAIGIVSGATGGGYRAQAIISPQPKNDSSVFIVQRDYSEYAYFKQIVNEI